MYRFQRGTEVVESFGTLGSNAFFWNTNVPAGASTAPYASQGTITDESLAVWYRR